MRNLACFLFAFCILLSSCSKNDSDNTKAVLSIDALNFSSYGGEEEVTCIGNGTWQYDVDGQPDWLSVVRTSAYTFKITANNNDTDYSRHHIITFRCNNNPVELWITQSAKPFLRFETDAICQVSHLSQILPIKVAANIKYKLSITTEEEAWVEKYTPNKKDPFRSDELLLKIESNLADAPRCAEIIITSVDKEIADTLTLLQEEWKIADNFYDGEVITLQQSAVGNVNLVIMGDGFVAEHLNRGGHYEVAIRQAAENFFSIEPYSTYRDYFNVYMVVAESDTDKIGSGGRLDFNSKETRFKTSFGAGTEINCDDDLVFEYVSKVTHLQDDEPVLCILVLNVDRYAGTCYMYIDGNAIALCPMCTLGDQFGFESIIHHEAGGHGFGFFADEYVYHETNMPQSSITDIRQWQEHGFQMNLDFTDDPVSVHWADFIGLHGYECVGIYEGGQEYKYGVWRSEEDSCMNENLPYYSTYCRWLIYKRIMELSGLSASKDVFFANDNAVPPLKLNLYACDREFTPTGKPRLKYVSKR